MTRPPAPRANGDIAEVIREIGKLSSQVQIVADKVTGVQERVNVVVEGAAADRAKLEGAAAELLSVKTKLEKIGRDVEERASKAERDKSEMTAQITEGWRLTDRKLDAVRGDVDALKVRASEAAAMEAGAAVTHLDARLQVEGAKNRRIAARAVVWGGSGGLVAALTFAATNYKAIGAGVVGLAKLIVAGTGHAVAGGD